MKSCQALCFFCIAEAGKGSEGKGDEILMETIKLKLKTPLWTGDIDTRSDIVRASGFMGSLRWWTEALMRGREKTFVCDPVLDGRCPEKMVQQKNEIYFYCPVCLLFGATGWQRAFKIQFAGGKGVFNGQPIKIVPQGRTNGWRLGSGLWGEIALSVVPYKAYFDPVLILLPLLVATHWGGLGAKTQHGYGVADIIGQAKLKEKAAAFSDQLKELKKMLPSGFEIRGGTNSYAMPNLKEMFFAKIRFTDGGDDWWKGVDGIKERKGQNGYYEGLVKDPKLKKWVTSGSVPIAPAVKNWLRYGGGRVLWEKDQNIKQNIANWLFGSTKTLCPSCYGTIKEDTKNTENYFCGYCKKSFPKEKSIGKNAAKVNVSCAYPVNNGQWEFRIWGWLPTKDDRFEVKTMFLNKLKASLEGQGEASFPFGQLFGDKVSNGRLSVWREFGSPRDTVSPDNKDYLTYLDSLSEEKEGDS